MWVKSRKVGSIGIFSWMQFPVQTKTEWFEKYSDLWELMCFDVGVPN